MGKFIHLQPEERKELVNNIVRKLEPQLQHYIKLNIGGYAITEEEVVKRVKETIDQQISAHVRLLPKPIKPKWWAAFLFE